METLDFDSLLYGRRRKRPTMLIYFMPDGDRLDSSEFQMAQANADSLIKTWEVAGFPLAFIGGGWTWRRARQWPSAGSLFFATNAPSLLRDRNFQSLDEDLGFPELFLAGGTFEEKIIPTVIDAYLNGRPVLVASDTLFFRYSARPSESDRTKFCALLSSYARLLNAREIGSAIRLRTRL